MRFAYFLRTEHMTADERLQLDAELAGSARSLRADLAAALGGEVVRG